MRRKLFAAVCAALLVVLIHAASQAFTSTGESQSIGTGTVHTYVEQDDTNTPTEISVILSDTALSNLPDDTHEYVLQLPPQAANIAITHIGLNWKPQGHLPPPIYGTPHFDIHAYVITPEEREAITATGADLEKTYATPAADLIPTAYVMAPESAEPRQGSHWIDPTAQEFQGEPHGFDHTLIYGFYDGKMTFIEPMVTLNFLQSHQNFEGTIATPTRYTKAGAYPSTYSITYNEATGEHVITLKGFTSQAERTN